MMSINVDLRHAAVEVVRAEDALDEQAAALPPVTWSRAVPLGDQATGHRDEVVGVALLVSRCSTRPHEELLADAGDGDVQLAVEQQADLLEGEAALEFQLPDELVARSGWCGAVDRGVPRRTSEIVDLRARRRAILETTRASVGRRRAPSIVRLRRRRA